MERKKGGKEECRGEKGVTEKGLSHKTLMQQLDVRGGKGKRK